MKPFKIDDKAYNTLEEIKRELLVETIDGCLYMMFLHQPSANSATLNNTLAWYAGRLSLFTHNLDNANETNEEAQVAIHLRNLEDYLRDSIGRVDILEQRREITEKILAEITPIARGLERKTGTVRDSYDEKFLLDYAERLLKG